MSVKINFNRNQVWNCASFLQKATVICFDRNRLNHMILISYMIITEGKMETISEQHWFVASHILCHAWFISSTLWSWENWFQLHVYRENNDKMVYSMNENVWDFQLLFRRIANMEKYINILRYNQTVCKSVDDSNRIPIRH